MCMISRHAEHRFEKGLARARSRAGNSMKFGLDTKSSSQLRESDFGLEHIANALDRDVSGRIAAD